MGWLSGYGYRKQITIVGSAAGAQSNYQLALTVHRGVGGDSGSHVYLNDLCRTDFNDVRFTKSDGSTELYHWRESYVSGVSAVFWIEFDSIPADPDTATFYIYYSDPDAISGSDGGNTFLFFDDFPGDSIDTGKWDDYTAGCSVSGGILTYSGDGVNVQWLKSIPQAGQITVAMRSRLKILAPAGYVCGFGPYNPARSHGARSYLDSGANNWFVTVDGVAQTYVTTNWVTGAYGIADIIVRGGVNVAFLWDGTGRTNSPKTTNPPNDATLEVGFYGKKVELQIDWVLMRNYCYLEPTWGDWGEQEEPVPPRIRGGYSVGHYVIGR